MLLYEINFFYGPFNNICASLRLKQKITKILMVPPQLILSWKTVLPNLLQPVPSSKVA